MASGLEEIPFIGEKSTVSAPSSADFFNQSQEPLEQPLWAFSGDFPRLQNGLVDIEAYQEYLPDHPDTIPPIVRYADKIGWRHQHLYFWRSFYRQKYEPKPLRDLTLLYFWRSPYNQLLMRISEESKVHDRYKSLVSPPPIETMEKSLKDFGLLDQLGSAAVGRRVSLVPEAFSHVREGLKPHAVTRLRSPAEIATIFDREIETAIERLKNPLVTPQRVVTGAISRMARLTRNPRLLEEAERRTAEDPIFYPVRIREPQALFVLSNQLLDKHRLIVVHPVNEA